MKVISVSGLGTGSSARVRDDDGVERTVILASPNPTDTEIIDAALLARPRDLVGTTKTQIESASLLPFWTAWWRWKTTLDEITARNLAVPGTYPAAVVTAVSTKVTSAWGDYAAAILLWRTAA